MNLKEEIIKYAAESNITLKKWQFEEIYDFLKRADPAFTGRKSKVWKWGRGMSKSFCAAFIAAFAAYYFHAKINYMIAVEDQLVVIRDYFRTLAHVTKVTADIVYVDNIPLIHTGSVTFASSSGNRYDIVIIDEIAGLMFYPAKEQFIQKVDGTLSNSCIGLTLYQSTPLIGSLFQTICEDHEKTYDSSWHNFENTPDNFCNVDRILQKREELIRMGLEWQYKTEYLGIFCPPSGSPFTNLIFEDFDYMDEEYNGLDFHGEFGTVRVSLAIKEHTNDVYAVSEARYPIPTDAIGLDLSFIENFSGRTFCEGGSAKKDGKIAIGSFNAGFMLEARKYGVVALGNDAGSKSKRLLNALKYRIHINRKLTPNLYHDFQNAAWDDASKLQLLKDAKHPNHYLDACLIALPMLHTGLGVWGKTAEKEATRMIIRNENLRRNSIVRS